MKYFFTFISLLGLVLFFSACTKEDEFLEKPTWSKLSISTTSTTKNFEVWLDNQLLLDSLKIKKGLLTKPIPSGEHRLRIRQFERNDYLVDTLINFAWSTKPYGFSLIEFDPQSDPLLFSGFPDNIPAHEEGFETFAFLNVDATITKSKTIDILMYSTDDPNVLVQEFDHIPYNKISTYFKIPANPNNISGFLVIRDAESKNILFDGRESYMIINLPSTYPGSSNTFLLKFTNGGDDQFPYYSTEPIFEATR